MKMVCKSIDVKLKVGILDEYLQQVPTNFNMLNPECRMDFFAS